MKNGAMLRYAEKSDLGKWPKVTSPRVPSQCLPINFIFLIAKNIVYMTTAAVHR